MNTPRLVLCATLLCASLAAQAAQREEQSCQRRYFLTPDRSLELLGAYPLSNGDLLRVERAVNRYYAEMHTTGRIEIVPVDEDEFVEKAGPVHLRFERLPFATDVKVLGLDGRPSGPPVCN